MNRHEGPTEELWAHRSLRYKGVREAGFLYQQPLGPGYRNHLQASGSSIHCLTLVNYESGSHGPSFGKYQLYVQTTYFFGKKPCGLYLLIATDHHCNGILWRLIAHHSQALWGWIHSCFTFLFFFSLMLQTQVSMITHHAHTIVIMNQPSTLLSSCSFFISKYFPIFLTWIETWLVPKYVASPADLSMVSCQTSHSLCFSGLRNAFLALKCNILTSVLTMRLCTILSLMLLALLFFRWLPGGSMGFTEDWFIDSDMTGDLNIFYK